MKAIVRSRYGSPDVLQLQEVEKPVPKDGEVLVQVHAASVNTLDWHIMRGQPFLLRIGGGLRKPKDPRLGVDLAGRVEGVGANVTQFQVGDDVFGMGHGAFAEFACAAENRLALKPTDLSYEAAAAVPIAATTALQGLRDKGHVRPGEQILIQGASRPTGRYVMVGASSHLFQALFQAFLLGPVLSRMGSKKVGGLLANSSQHQQDLAFLKELLESGKVVPVVERRYALRETSEAIHYLEAGHASGKVVITV
jgi:NADPH:quinone reductase-like Zn-dependent oxidoreductase